MISAEEHLDKLAGLLFRREQHIRKWWSKTPLKSVKGQVILPALEASRQNQLT